MAKAQRFTKCNLREVMKKNNVTFKELAEQVGVSFQQVQKYATGENEMSLKMLLETCRFLNCSPADIYPEVEFYENSVNIPKTQTQPQDEGFAGTVINNHYYAKPTLAETLRGLFADIKILDTNALGIKLIKLAVFSIIIYDLLYIGFRAFGQPFSPFFTGPNGVPDNLSQLASGWAMYTWPLSLVLPLVLRHWLVYVVPILTFRGILNVIETALDMHFLSFDNTLDSQSVWIIKTLIALVLTLIYAWFVNKYLRKNSGKKANAN